MIQPTAKIYKIKHQLVNETLEVRLFRNGLHLISWWRTTKRDSRIYLSLVQICIHM